MRLLKAIALLTAFLAASPLPAQTPQNPQSDLPEMDRPFKYFANYCVANFVTDDFKTDKVLQSIGATEYKDDQTSKDYLEGKKGRVWGFKYKGDDYFIALTSSSCKLYSWYGDREKAWDDFERITGLLFSPWKRKELLPTRIYKDGPTYRNSRGIYYEAPPTRVSPAFIILTDYSGSKRQPAIQLTILWDETRKLDELNAAAHKIP